MKAVVPPDSDGGDDFAHETNTADDTASERGEGAHGEEFEIPELSRVSALQVGWVPPAGRSIAPHTHMERVYTQHMTPPTPPQAQLQNFTKHCVFDRTYLTRSVPLPARGSAVQVIEEATQLQLRQAKGWVRDWMPHTGTLCITIPQHNSDAQHMRGRLGTHTTCSMGVGQGAWKGDGQAQKERTHTCNTHTAVVWPSEVQPAGHDMATQHTMKRAQLYTHAHSNIPRHKHGHTRRLQYVQQASMELHHKHWDFPGITSLRRFREDLKTTWERWGRPLGQHIKLSLIHI